jgi:hypothetical protein
MIFPKQSAPQKHSRPACERLPIASIVLFILTGLSILLSLIFRLSPAFSDFFNRYISQGLRRILAAMTSFLPFSLAEILLMLSPALLVLLIIYALRTHASSRRAVGMYALKLLSGACVFFILFVSVFSAGYYGTPLSHPDKLDLDRRDVSADELYATGLHLVENMRREVEHVQFEHEDFSIMPYTRKEMNQKLMVAYEDFCEEHDFIATFKSRVKPVILSRAMSYTHITGVYSYFTGEANLNVDFPDYTLPFTAAHELAHQRGIAREDEANFIAYLVCISSDDAYIRYCGYLNLYEYVASALYRADPDLYFELRDQLPMTVRYELAAYSEFFDQYRDSVAGEISGTVNDLYLKGNGTEGTQSYGLVVDLAVAYDKKTNP